LRKPKTFIKAFRVNGQLTCRTDLLMEHGSRSEVILMLRPCPQCKRLINVDATTCPNCGSSVKAAPRVVVAHSAEQHSWAEGAWLAFVGGLKVMSCVVVLGFFVVALYLGVLLHYYPKEAPLPPNLPPNIPRVFPESLIPYVPTALRPQMSREACTQNCTPS
jgi:hypothetical protein